MPYSSHLAKPFIQMSVPTLYVAWQADSIPQDCSQNCLCLQLTRKAGLLSLRALWKSDRLELPVTASSKGCCSPKCVGGTRTVAGPFGWDDTSVQQAIHRWRPGAWQFHCRSQYPFADGNVGGTCFRSRRPDRDRGAVDQPWRDRRLPVATLCGLARQPHRPAPAVECDIAVAGTRPFRFRVRARLCKPAGDTAG